MNITDKKKGMSSVIKEFFGMSAAQAIKEYKELTEKDKVELASAAARELGLTQDDVSFVMVAY
jgi:hypothetical protein